jgi:lipopolysaccharide transport protein LptA
MRRIIFASIMLSFAFEARGDLLDDIEDLEKSTPVPPLAAPQPTDTVTIPLTLPGVSPTPVPPEPSGSRRPEPPKPSSGAKVEDKPKKEANEPVRFESKGLQGSKEQGTIDLMEEVVVTQADLRIEAKRATVFFTQSSSDVQKVIATGDVKLFKTDPDTGQKIRAEANEVVFLNSERKVLLKGNAKLWRGDDLMRGRQFTYELDTGWIRADRIEGVVQPSEEKVNGKADSKAGGGK